MKVTALKVNARNTKAVQYDVTTMDPKELYTIYNETLTS